MRVLGSRKWGKQEACYLKANYGKKTSKEIAAALSRSKYSVQEKAKKLGLKSGVCGKGRKWSKQEICYLKAHYVKTSAKRIAEILGRSQHSIYGKVRELGLKTHACGRGRKWDDGEIHFLRKSYEEKPIRQMARELSRSINSVQQKARRLGLKSSLRGVGSVWTLRETGFLSENIEKMSMVEIAEKLGKSLHSIYGKKRDLFPNKNLSIRNFDNTPTPKLAYVLGVIFGDGCVTYYRKQNSYRIYLRCTDKEFAKSFKYALESIGLHPSTVTLVKPRTERKKAVWRVEAQSKLFYKWFRALSFEKLKLFLKTKELKREFIRGFYESEGCLYRGQGGTGSWYIGVCNTNLDLIKLVKSILADLGFSFPAWISRRAGRKPLYVIQTGKFDNVVRFLQEIKPCIPRKSIARMRKAGSI